MPIFLQCRTGRYWPTLAKVQVTWGTITERARAKLRGKFVDEGEQARDRDTVERWAEAEGADLEDEAQRAKAELGRVDRSRE